MVRVFFFASIREAFGQSELEVEWQSGTVGELLGQLKKQVRLELPKELLFAVNQEMVDPDHPVRPGDEVGFFPPVTGG